MGSFLDAVHFTDWFILATVFSIAAVDLALVFFEAKTISNRTRAYGSKWASFPFAWGVLGGHFWGPGGGPLLGSWVWSISLLIACALGAMVIHRWARLEFSLPAWSVSFWLIPGFAAGFLLWPQ